MASVAYTGVFTCCRIGKGAQILSSIFFGTKFVERP